MLYRGAQESKKDGNMLFGKGQYEQAIVNYSTLITKVRLLEGKSDVVWTDASSRDIQLLMATANLNLSACFLKTEQWAHAKNTATLSLEGDVLPSDKKAKALFRRAQVELQRFNDRDAAIRDLSKALEYMPEDKGIVQEIQRVHQLQRRTAAIFDQQFQRLVRLLPPGVQFPLPFPPDYRSHTAQFMLKHSDVMHMPNDAILRKFMDAWVNTMDSWSDDEDIQWADLVPSHLHGMFGMS